MALVTLPGSGAVDWYGWAQQTDKMARSNQWNPLAEVRSDPLKISKGEYASVSQGAEIDLLNTSGPGNIESIWMATGGPGPSLDARLRIYYDGSGTAALDMDMGTLLAAHYGAGTAVGTHFTPHVQFQINSANYNTGWMITFSVPFGTSVRVAYYASTTAVSSMLFWMVTYSLYETDRASGQRLRGTGVRQPNAVALTAVQTYQLANLTGGPGTLLWLSYIGGFAGATNLSWMERNFSIAVDGEATPSMIASGTEDWFDSAWYFEGWRDFQSGLYSYVGTDASVSLPYAVGMATDFLGKWGGVPFTSSCVLTLETEAACTTGHSFCAALLYYSAA